jgi:hypothetical protein
MALSPNYGWAEPDNSSLVKNGAQDIRALGDAIDTSVWNVGYGQAGKNKIINGDFAINQRAFTTTSVTAYGHDRWSYAPSGATGTYTAETFTTGAAPIAGYEAKGFARLAVTTGNDLARMQQLIESVRTFAGQTVTVSFFAKGTNPATAGNLAVTCVQNFGTGGSPSAEVVGTQQTFVLTANWTRYSLTFNIPSISGKTIGTNNNDYLNLWIGQGTSVSADAWTLDLWGVQVEYGSKATPFQTASGGSPQAELAMCQRYYWRETGSSAYGIFGTALGATSTVAYGFVNPNTQMRAMNSISSTGICLIDGPGTLVAVTLAIQSTYTSTNLFGVVATAASGLNANRPYHIQANNSPTAFIAIDGEL